MTGIWKAFPGVSLSMQEWINTTAAEVGEVCILSMQEETGAKAKG